MTYIMWQTLLLFIYLVSYYESRNNFRDLRQNNIVTATFGSSMRNFIPWDVVHYRLMIYTHRFQLVNLYVVSFYFTSEPTSSTKTNIGLIQMMNCICSFPFLSKTSNYRTVISQIQSPRSSCLTTPFCWQACYKCQDCCTYWDSSPPSAQPFSCHLHWYWKKKLTSLVSQSLISWSYMNCRGYLPSNETGRMTFNDELGARWSYDLFLGIIPPYAKLITFHMRPI